MYIGARRRRVTLILVRSEKSLFWYRVAAGSTYASALHAPERGPRLRRPDPARRRSSLTQPAPPDPGPRRVQPVVALRLLEVMRDMDLPLEVLEEEDTTRTIPRRFGLNDVVERQIRQFREDVKKKVRITDEDVRGLFRFVIRRPDGPEVFEQVGRLLASGERSSRWIRMLPEGGRYHMARARTRRKLTKLFGRPVGGFGRPPFVIEGRALLFIEADPGGDACNLLSGFAQEVLGTTFGAEAEVRHTLCQGRGDDLCRWEGEIVGEAVSVAPEVANSGSGDEDPVDAENAEVLNDDPAG